MKKPIKKRIDDLERKHSSTDGPVEIRVVWDDEDLNPDDFIVGWPDDENHK